ncbi:MAG: Uma2 family endonuclease [Pirellulaceae bacterium]|nr:Uma2 family endonuclease [Pirellulaceae bacterium]
MSAAEKLNPKMTVDEYLAWERTQIERHEYFNGEVFSQAGGTRRHSLIGSNVLRAIGNFLEDHDCEAHGSDMRVHVEATGYHAYPDVSVVCAPIQGSSDDVISNPVLIVEVSSPSTADFDRGTKFNHYRQIPSLKEYIIFWQEEARAEQHTRTSDGLWLLRDICGIDESLHLASIGETLPLRAVYRKIKFKN